MRSIFPPCFARVENTWDVLSALSQVWGRKGDGRAAVEEAPLGWMNPGWSFRVSSQQKILSGRAGCCTQVFLLMHVGNAEQGCDLFRKGLLSEHDPGLWVRPCVPQHLLKNRTLVTKHLLLYQAHYNFIRAELLGHFSMAPLHFGKGIIFLHGGKRAEIKPKSCLSWMSMTTWQYLTCP